MANKETLLKRLVKLINDNSEISNEEKNRLSNEAEKLTKVEIQNAIDELNKKTHSSGKVKILTEGNSSVSKTITTKTSSSNEPNIEQIKDEIHQKIKETSLTKETKKQMHKALENLIDEEIIKMGEQKEALEKFIKLAEELESKNKKSKKTKQKEEEVDQVLEDHKGSYILDPQGKNIVVRVRQKEACRIFQVKKSKGSVTVICGEQKLVIPRKDQHVLYLDGALSLN